MQQRICSQIDSYLRGTAVPMAFVLGQSVTALGAIRGLGRRGVPVLGIDGNPWQPARWSRYCQSVVCPDPKIDEAGCVEFLLDIGSRPRARPVLMPAGDAFVGLVAHYAEALGARYRLPPAPPEVIQALLDKKAFGAAMANAGLPHPATFAPESAEELWHIAEQISYPCILKPALTYRNALGDKVLRVESPAELAAAFERSATKGEDFIVQEIIPGDDRDMYAFASYADQDHVPIAFFMYRKIRGYPRRFGACSLVESVADPVLADAGKRALRTLRYQGLSEIEFKKDPRDAAFKIIEVNARTWAQNSLAERCGANLCYVAYCHAIGRAVPEQQETRAGVKWLFGANDVRSSFGAMMSGDLQFAEYLDSLAGEKVYAFFARDDPAPFLAWFVDAALRVTPSLDRS